MSRRGLGGMPQAVGAACVPHPATAAAPHRRLSHAAVLSLTPQGPQLGD